MVSVQTTVTCENYYFLSPSGVRAGGLGTCLPEVLLPPPDIGRDHHHVVLSRVSEHEQGRPPTTQRLLVMPGLPLIIDIEFPALISIRGTDQDHTQHTLALPIGI